jgi:protocatechuate 3,4-dioxygenase beta subunit
MRAFLTFVVFALAVQSEAPELVPAVYLSPKYLAPQNAPSSIVVARPDEPGQRLIVTGRVIDGTKLIASASVYVFQTDAKGFYAPDRSGPDAELDPRLHAHCAPTPKGGTNTKPFGRVATAVMLPTFTT